MDIKYAYITEEGRKGIKLWKDVFGDNLPATTDELSAGLKPVGSLKETLFPDGREFPVTENRKDALKILIENPAATTALTEYLKTNDAARQKLAEAFTSGSKEQLTQLANEALKGPQNVAAALGAGSSVAAAPVAPAQPSTTKTDKREEALVDTVLTAATTLKGATDIAKVPGVKFHKGNGEYAEGHITEDSITQLSISTNGKTRYFTQVEKTDGSDSPTGFKASAWVETDAKGNYLEGKTSQVWLCYPGYEGTPNDGTAETKSMYAVGEGKLNPQTSEVPAFVDKALAKVDPDHISAVNIGAHSLGASNALASKVMLEAKGVPAKTTLLIEPAGATLAETKIKESLRDANSPLAKAASSHGYAPEKAIAALDNKDNTVSIRSVVTANGTVSYSNTAMLQPGQQAVINAATSISGRNGEIDALNETVGDKLHLNMTGAANVAGAKHDQTHSATNIANALQTGAALGDKPQATSASTAARPEAGAQNGEKLQQILAQNPRFGDLLTKIYANSQSQAQGGKTDPQIQAIVEDVMAHPEKLEPLAQLVESQPALITAIEGGIKNGGTPNPKAIETLKVLVDNPEGTRRLTKTLQENPELTTIIADTAKQVDKMSAKRSPAATEKMAQQVNDFVTYAVTKPDEMEATAKKLSDLGSKVKGLAKEYPSLTMLASQYALAGKTGSMEEVGTKMDAGLETIRILNENPAFAKMADGIALKVAKDRISGKQADAGSQQIIETLKDPVKLEAVAKLVQNHPSIGDLIGNGIQGAQSNPKMTAAIQTLINDPDKVADIDQAFTENKDLEALLTGKIGSEQIMGDISGFLKRNPTLLSYVQDPTVKPLIENSQFAKENPTIMGLMQDKGVTGMMAAIFGGGMGHQQSDAAALGGADEEDQQALAGMADPETSLAMMLLQGLISMFCPPDSDMGKMATQLMAGLGGQQQAAASI